MLDSVDYAGVGRAAACFQRVRFCPAQLSDVVTALRETIELAELWVLNEIDPQVLLRRGGYSIGATRQIMFFHPRILARILEADPAALLEAPLKFAVLELPNRTVMVRWIDPSTPFARYGSAVLTTLGIELAATYAALADAAIGSLTSSSVDMTSAARSSSAQWRDVQSKSTARPERRRLTG